MCVSTRADVITAPSIEQSRRDRGPVCGSSGARLTVSDKRPILLSTVEGQSTFLTSVRRDLVAPNGHNYLILTLLSLVIVLMPLSLQ